MTALGLIETKGLLAAIECADAMLKAANVRLLEKNLAGGGLVTISIAGDVAAVKASVDAAVAAVERIKGAVLVSAHVIARPDAELSRIISTKVPDVRLSSESQRATLRKDALASPTNNGSVPLEKSQLKKMSMNRLRQIAGTLARFSMTQEQMESASKTDLVEAIIAASRQEEE